MEARPSNHGVVFWCDDIPSPCPEPIAANVTMFYLQLLCSLVVPQEGVGIKTVVCPQRCLSLAAGINVRQESQGPATRCEQPMQASKISHVASPLS